ncbi:hypothetical protein GCK72_004799 [Caenorhabditis remanei]|uniref:Arrestin C-terminal-like domain-containing protein n=1 Tax=Caenorhabditis remanei TaxID=31234 RepID=A0A6A5HCW4_CAERE|nr:hypothetical protein GCK72_004799 [Caenorhabditis remanei]KAF1764849.1 hypothetical protein GCK72_004799 [Caenorhabditis remanei]
MAEPIITFDEPDKKFLPGDKVTGKVTLELAKPMKARSVQIYWMGFSRTWGVKFISYPNSKTIFYGTEMVWVAKDGKNELPAGKHEYPFSFILPADSPPTFVGLNGRNEYTVEVVIDRPWRLKKIVDKEFCVTKDMKHEFDIWETGYDWEFTRKIDSGLIFSSGPITLDVAIPKLAFEPGEKVNIEFKITNHSGSAVRQIFAEFNEHGHYHHRCQLTPCKDRFSCPLSIEEFKNARKEMASEKRKVYVAPHSEGTFVMPFVIPPEAKTPNFKTGLMSMDYFFYVGVRVENKILVDGLVLGAFIGDRVAKKEETSEVVCEEKSKEQEVSETSAPPAYTP